MPRHPRVSRTTDELPDSTFQALSRKLREHSGTLHRLSVGDTWMEPPECARCESLSTREHPMMHAYAPPHGDPALLDAIVEKLEARLRHAGRPRKVDREAVQVMAGATGGLSITCQTLLDAGDEVIIPSPFWPLIRGIVASRGAVPVEVPFWTRLDEPGFDVEATLERAITPRTAAIYVNSPHNPTGRILTDDQAGEIARVAQRHDLWVISDEVYEDLWLDDAAPAPIWTRDDISARCLATHSLSKAYGMAGARVGYTHGPAEAMRKVRAVQTQQAYCAARPMQVAGARALKGGDEWLRNARRLYAEAATETAHALGLPRPWAGTFVFFDAARWLGPDGDLLPLLERCVEAGVLLTPGSACGRDFATWIRLCYTTVPPAELTDALRRLAPVFRC
jgi:N-succinyldiaminopimelate aminotransferase